MTSDASLLPLGDFKPTDEWQTHVNEIFYGVQGSGIHNHFQTYVSQDFRLAHALAEEYFIQSQKRANSSQTRFIMEWGVGNGNLAGCFLTHLQAIDTENKVYPFTRYILCDFSMEILKAAKNNLRLKNHTEKFSTIQIDANNMDCFREQTIDKVISNEIWDDLATKVLLKQEDSLCEEYIQPLIDPGALEIDFDSFAALFNEKNLDALKHYHQILPLIFWERAYQRVDIEDWPHTEILKAHVDCLKNKIPVPVNLGALATLERAHHLLRKDGLGYSGMDYGMYSLRELNHPERPHFNLYGGQYTCMVNFELLCDWAHAVGFSCVEKEYQHRYVGKHLQDRVISLLELVQTHQNVHNMPPWDRDILMLKTLHILNITYKSPYYSKMKYPVMTNTPNHQRERITKLANTLNTNGVPDTVAYVSEKEVKIVSAELAELGYNENDYNFLFQGPTDPVSFIIINLS